MMGCEVELAQSQVKRLMNEVRLAKRRSRSHAGELAGSMERSRIVHCMAMVSKLNRFIREAGGLEVPVPYTQWRSARDCAEQQTQQGALLCELFNEEFNKGFKNGA